MRGDRPVIIVVGERPLVAALAELATDDGFDAENDPKWLEDTEATGYVIERDGKYWVVRKSKFAFGEFDHPV